MAVDRLLPTDEGAELVSLVREIAQAELAPRAAADEAAAEVSSRRVCPIGRGGITRACRIQRSTAAPASRTRSTCRLWKRSRWPG